MSVPKQLDRGLSGIIDRLQEWQSALGKLYGQPTSGMLTEFKRDGQPVILFRNPKTGGKSLRMLLGVKRLSHTPPAQRLSERNWQRCYSVVAVRDPFERFLSGYFNHVRGAGENALTRMYGWDFKKITPLDYLEVLDRHPKFGGPQVQWTDFPCAAKPRADLVLRFEDIARWCEQLCAADIDVSARTLPHHHRSARGQGDILTMLGMSDTEYLQLETEVRQYFKADAVAFGYPQQPVTPDRST
jgi:hypothetical protein